jgi:hypothetical protein
MVVEKWITVAASGRERSAVHRRRDKADTRLAEGEDWPVCPAASGAAVVDPRLAHHLGRRRRVLGSYPDHGLYRACQGGGTGHSPPSGPGLPACELPAKPCSARGRPGPGPWRGRLIMTAPGTAERTG